MGTELSWGGNSMLRPCRGRLVMNGLRLLMILDAAGDYPFSSLPLGIKLLHIGFAIRH